MHFASFQNAFRPLRVIRNSWDDGMPRLLCLLTERMSALQSYQQTTRQEKAQYSPQVFADSTGSRSFQLRCAVY
jgi:hypothetical protein